MIWIIHLETDLWLQSDQPSAIADVERHETADEMYGDIYIAEHVVKIYSSSVGWMHTG
jgi:hypothetical protein